MFFSIVGAISIHEAAHAYAASVFGDDTPRLQGRLTLNPLAHLDPLGTLLIVFIGIGWGKPVQFNPFNLRDFRRDTALIALAGPASNLVLAALSALLMGFIGFNAAMILFIQLILAPVCSSGKFAFFNKSILLFSNLPSL